MKIIRQNSIAIAIIEKETKLNNFHEIMDIIANVRYKENSKNVGMIVHKESLDEKFFDLKTKFAGELLQKFSNYRMNLVIVGDFTGYKSKSLNDFVRECNRGNLIFFLTDVDSGLEKYKQLYK